MIRKIRKWVRLIAILGTTLFLFLMWYPLHILLKPCRKARYKWRELIQKTWAWLLSGIINIRYEVHGTAPKPPYFLVSNHLSYLDMVVFCRYISPRFVAKKDVLSWPIIGRLVKSLGTIFIDRNKKSALVPIQYSLDDAMRHHENIILFPEGTSTDGTRVFPFKPGLLHWPAENQQPVHYCCVHYQTRQTEPPASEAVCWWQDVTLSKHVMGLLELSEIKALIHFGETPIFIPDRKGLATALEKHVSDLLKCHYKHAL